VEVRDPTIAGFEIPEDLQDLASTLPLVRDPWIR